MIDPRGLKLFIVDLAFLTLAWLFFWLRALVTVTKIRRVSLDDILMFASIVIYTAHNTISLWGIVNASQIGDGNIIAGESIALHSWFLCEVIYAPLSALIRTSIGFFLLRIATVKWHRYTIYGTLGVVWALTLPFFSLLLFQCFPPEHFYKQILPEASSGSCLEHTIVPLVTMAHSVIFSLIDFVLALFPIAILWNVQLSKRTKAGVAALLGTGVLAGTALVVRIPYIDFTPVSSAHFLGRAADAALWSILEMSFGIIAGCAATLRPLVSSLPSRRRSNHRNRGTLGGNSNSNGNNSNNHGEAVPNIRRTDDGVIIGRSRRDCYWHELYSPGSGTGSRAERFTSNHASSSSSATLNSSKLPGSWYEMDSDSDSTREMRPRGYYSGYGYNYGYPVGIASPGGNGDPSAGQGSTCRNDGTKPSPSVVHVQTSIEVMRDEHENIARRERVFPFQRGRVVSIHGPVKEGLSTQTY